MHITLQSLKVVKNQILAITDPYQLSDPYQLFESLIATKIMEHLELNLMLHESQFAYMKKTSTEHAVLTMTEEWRKKLDLLPCWM